MSPDPYDGSYDASNPQSFNRYAYVLNSPLAFTDPNGQDIPDCSSDDCGDGGGEIGGSGYGSSPGEGGDTPGNQGNVPTIQGPGVTIFLNPYISTGLIQGIGSVGGIQQIPSIIFTGGGSVAKTGRRCIANCGKRAPKNPSQPKKGRCPPSGPQPTTDLGKLINVYSTLTHPVEVGIANGFMFATSGILYAGAGLAVTGGCLDPTPFEPATCIAGVAAGGVTATAATGAGAAGVAFFKNVTLPAFKEWGCTE
jgi:hypothetical protein